ncbi:MAG: hypothetical protein ABEH47_01160 [Haloferacaceae archaeon]
MAGRTRSPAATDWLDAAEPPVSNVLVLSSSLDATPTPASVSLGPADRPLVYVALTRRDLTLLDRWLAVTDSDRDVRLVDATPGDHTPAPDLPGTDVAAPDALTDLGVALSETLAAAGRDPVCSFRSLTALRQYVDRRRAYRFLNAAVDRTEAGAAVACYGVDPRALADRDVHAFASLFDAVHDRRAVE